MGRLDGKTALITGAARGTGETTARLFAREGARVVLGDILHERGETVAKEIGEQALYVPLDVGDEADWERAMRTTTERFGALNVLVNNAAVLDVASVTETTLESFHHVLRVNLVGTFLGVRAAVEPMKVAGGGSIINVASIDAVESHNGIVAYAASKWGVRGVTKTAAIELAKYGIRVNTLCPGPGSAEMVRPFVEKVRRELERSGTPPAPLSARPTHRRGEMIDVARTILFLASDDSEYVSGADLTVDMAGTAGKFFPTAPSA